MVCGSVALLGMCVRLFVRVCVRWWWCSASVMGERERERERGTGGGAVARLALLAACLRLLALARPKGERHARSVAIVVARTVQ